MMSRTTHYVWVLTGFASALACWPQLANAQNIFNDYVTILATNDFNNDDPPRLAFQDKTYGTLFYVFMDVFGTLCFSPTGSDNYTPFCIDGHAPHRSLYINDNVIGTVLPLNIYAPTGDAMVSLEAQSGRWDLLNTSDPTIVPGNGGFALHFANGGPELTPFVIQQGAATDSLFIDSLGNVGMGTSAPGKVINSKVLGQVLNVRSDTNFAQFAVQGQKGCELNLVDLSAAANHANFRMRVRSGYAYFEVPKDDFSAMAVPNALVMNMATGSVGIGIIPAMSGRPLALGGGAYCTGAVWTNASSRELKDDIKPLTTEQARETVRHLQPVGYRYKSEPDEAYVGFIAEDVPDLVASNDRKSLSPMDITAVLTKVVQDQDKTIASQQETIERQEKTLAQQQVMLQSLSQRLAELEAKMSRLDSR